MKKAFVALAIAAFASTAFADIASSRHNLTVGSNNGGNTAQIGSCQFCHAPHDANTTNAGTSGTSYGAIPLWNRVQPTANYLTKATQANPNGSGQTPALGAGSYTCLSCHDGVADIGATFSSGPGLDVTSVEIPAGGFDGTRGTDVGATFDGTNWSAPATVGDADLRDDHPVGIIYNGGSFNLVAAPAGVKFYTAGSRAAGSYMECGTCHDPHDTTTGPTKFLRVAATALCATCHTK